MHNLPGTSHWTEGRTATILNPMSGLRLARIPRWLSLVVAAMSGILALDYLRGYFADPSTARLVALAFWAVNAVVWSWVFALSLKRNDSRDDG